MITIKIPSLENWQKTEVKKALKYNKYAFVWGDSGYKVRDVLLAMAIVLAGEGNKVVFLTLSQAQREIIFNNLIKCKPSKDYTIHINNGSIMFDTSTSRKIYSGNVLIVQYMNNFKNMGLDKILHYENMCEKCFYSGEAIGNTVFENRVCILERIHQVSSKPWNELHPTETEKNNITLINTIADAALPNYGTSVNLCTWEFKEKRKKHPLDPIRIKYKHKLVVAPNFKYQNLDKHLINRDQIDNIKSCEDCKNHKRYNSPLTYRNHPYKNDILCIKYDFLIENATGIHIQKGLYPICDDFEEKKPF